MNRRRFLNRTGLLTGAALAWQLKSSLWAMPENSRYQDTIGLQLWTVRNQMADDKKKTLAAIASAGYKQVELMDTAHAEELLPICEDLGLKVTSAFFNWEVIGNPTGKDVPSVDAIIEQATAANLKHLVFGYIGKGHRETVDQFKRNAEASNVAGEKLKAAGLRLCYHNHSFEFKKLTADTCGFDVFMEHFDKELVPFELDIFWVAVGGWRPIPTLQKLAGRVSQVHLKDLQRGTVTNYDEGSIPPEAFKELGNGILNIAEILKVCEQVGVEQCHVEQDQSPDPLASVAQSLDYLRKL